MKPHRHWVLYSHGPPLRIDEETKDAVLLARKTQGTRIREDDWQGKGGGLIELPELIEVTDVFGAKCYLNPMTVSMVVEVRLELFHEVAEWNAGIQSLAEMASATYVAVGSSEE